MIRLELRLYLIVGLIALLSWALVRHYEEKRDVELKISENSPDFFSSGYYKKQMDSEGLPKNELLDDKMQHYKADGATHLERPFMTLFNNNGVAPWLIRANQGIMAADGDNLQLIGQSFISREATNKNSALQINTADLHVKLRTNYADTAAWTELISPPNKTTGTGMEVTFVSPIHLKLLSKVKGRYELK